MRSKFCGSVMTCAGVVFGVWALSVLLQARDASPQQVDADRATATLPDDAFETQLRAAEVFCRDVDLLREQRRIREAEGQDAWYAYMGRAEEEGGCRFVPPSVRAMAWLAREYGGCDVPQPAGCVVHVRFYVGGVPYDRVTFYESLEVPDGG